jgi:hypothetical protein
MLKYCIILSYEDDLTLYLEYLVAVETEQITLKGEIGVAELNPVHFNIILLYLLILKAL